MLAMSESFARYNNNNSKLKKVGKRSRTQDKKTSTSSDTSSQNNASPHKTLINPQNETV